jgi:hypothetical protein
VRGGWLKRENRCIVPATSFCEYEDTKPRKTPTWFALNDDRPLFGTGMSQKTLALLHRRLKPLSTRQMPLAGPPPRETGFGGKLALSRVHWVRPELVAEITYLTWAKDGLLRHTVFVGLSEGKPAREVRRETPA